MKPTCMAICGALLLAPSGAPAFAGSKSAASGQPASAQGDLPGVDGAYSIVTPLPPEPDTKPASGQFGRFRVGNLDVKVSGKLTYDIGIGSLRTPKR
ncbi:hypothetical protein [Aquamicrobium defluvii]|uniref:Porin n=2 Tax=Aquamicrobium defluvii TaxID=69279 RepID=A0A4R6Y811_9HYPH|nr:hypothetical protein [Aquamicrobium defluvii]TDR31478.1 hypothetical protein DES43_13342 [Aquamicrobium defluvii]